ncbi:MAG: zinc dependent phospholipase C family protein [Geobacteraceae bacterium]|nr:zinc dependent phospholipase C family protein [Geobacteraceae bacterium]
MGKELSHIICAEQTAQSLVGSVGGGFLSLLRDYSTSYHFGAIAADTFFYAVRLPSEPERSPCCGDMIHGADGNDTSRPVHEMLKFLRDTPNDSLYGEKAAFVCGFLTHIALDSTLHPFVYHVSGNYYADCPLERRDSQVRHRLIESWLDLHMLDRASMRLARCRYLSEIRGKGALNRELMRFFLDACEKSFDVHVDSWERLLRGYRVQMLLNAAFRSAMLGKTLRLVDGFLSGRLQSFLALFYPWHYPEVPGEIINFDSFLHPVTGEQRNGGFQHLWRQSLERGGEFLESVEKFLFLGRDDDELRKVIRGYSLSTGLEGVAISEAVHFERIPLERLWLHGTRGR